MGVVGTATDPSPAHPPAPPAASSTPTAKSPTSKSPTATSSSIALRDGRTVEISALGAGGDLLVARLGRELDDAADAVTSFWGDDWPRHLDVVLTGTVAQFAALGEGGPDIAATTTATRIVFAPGAAAMSDAALRVVLRHEMFHYASRNATAADAPRWLTEGVADFVGRPATPVPGPLSAARLAVLPTDADLATPGATRNLAYDRAWWFSRYVAARYGPAALRELYLAACGSGHADAATAIRTVLGEDTDRVLTAWRAWLAG